MTILIKWFPPSWFQIKTKTNIIYVDPAYLSTNFKHDPKKIEFSKWPDPIDGLPEELEKGNIILITHHHKDHCKKVTVDSWVLDLACGSLAFTSETYANYPNRSIVFLDQSLKLLRKGKARLEKIKGNVRKIFCNHV